MIYVLFGPPGVGKTYIGGLLEKSLGMRFFDADVLFDDEMKKLVRSGNFSTEKRDIFFERLRVTTESLLTGLRNGQDLVLAQAFTKEKNRVNFSNAFDNQIKYVLVHAPKTLAHSRMVKRLLADPHIIDEGAFEYAWREFEDPRIEHVDLINDDLDNEKIVVAFEKFK